MNGSNSSPSRFSVEIFRMNHASAELAARIVDECREWMKGREEIEFAFLYGSFVSLGTFHDVDLGLFLNEQSLQADFDIASDLSGRLTSRFRLPFDVRVLNDAPVSFLYHVFRGRLVYCVDPERLADRVEYVLPRYFDRCGFLRHYTREAFAA